LPGAKVRFIFEAMQFNASPLTSNPSQWGAIRPCEVTIDKTALIKLPGGKEA
jgi:hypothetical protein